MDEKIEFYGTRFSTHKIGHISYWTPDPVGSKKATKLERPEEKIAKEKRDKMFAEKAQHRSDTCYLCNGTPMLWVNQVQFDMRHPDASVDQAVVDSSDYAGPVPGFCMGHLIEGPRHLAERVYADLPVIQWGLRPLRWWVVFTDGTKQGGQCQEFGSLTEIPDHLEKYTPAK